MSSDTGIYLLKNPAEHQVGSFFEYRVKMCQAIDNIYWEHDDGNPEQVVAYFGKCKVFTDEKDALQLAQQIEKEISEDDFCPYTEFGICQISLPHPFSYYVDENKQIKEKEQNEGADQD